MNMPVKLRLFTAAAGALLLSSALGMDGTKPLPGPRSELRPDDTMLAEITLGPREKRSFALEAEKKTIVGFITDLNYRSDITPAERRKYCCTIQLSEWNDVAPMVYASSIGWWRFNPKDGEVRFSIENTSDIQVGILLYTRRHAIGALRTGGAIHPR